MSDENQRREFLKAAAVVAFGAVAADAIAGTAEAVAAPEETAADAALATAHAPLTTAVKLPSGFKITEVPIAPGLGLTPQGSATPSLGPLAAFAGTFVGKGFNTIFRPHAGSPTQGLPNGDNVLELNLTSETLSFSASLGSVPNRGTVQPDVFLNGVPYLQTINDVTNPELPIGIHLEPGLWICVPPTTDPAESQVVTRMASIPHGTTLLAQGTSSVIAGPPTIPPVDITPLVLGNGRPIRFPSQTATATGTARIPQDLTPFIAAGTITQAILDNPNLILSNHLSTQKIVSTTQINISTNPASPLFGGGTENIAFLLGDPAANPPNAQATVVTATFWIETVQHTILVPPFNPGDRPLLLKPEGPAPPGGVHPTFIVDPPIQISAPRRITVTSVQIQYSQKVLLNFNGLIWPHVSVATLIPSDHIPAPTSVWG